MLGAEEADGGVRVTCTSADGEVLHIDASKLVKAYGFRITPNDPLPLSSDRVHSVSPDHCDVATARSPTATPGLGHRGGKTTGGGLRHVLPVSGEVLPGRSPEVVRRDSDQYLRVRGGSTLRRHQRDEVWRWHRARYGTWLTPDTANFLLGVLSEEECRTITRGLHSVKMDYLRESLDSSGSFSDAVDRDGGVEMTFRSGTAAPVVPGSCTSTAPDMSPTATIRTNRTCPRVGQCCRFRYARRRCI